MGIKPGADEHKLRLHFVSGAFHGAAIRIDINFARNTKMQRHVLREPKPCSSASLIGGAGSGVEAIAKAMHTQEKLRRIGVKDILSAVPVMNIPIDDQDSIDRVFFPGVSSGNRDVVEETKAHTSRGRGMV